MVFWCLVNKMGKNYSCMDFDSTDCHQNIWRGFKFWYVSIALSEAE